MKLIIYWTDALVYVLLIGLLVWLYLFRKTQEWHLIRIRINQHPHYLVALMILFLYGFIGLLDSIHFKVLSNHFATRSVLDVLLAPYDQVSEVTYSAPFAIHAAVPDKLKDIVFRMGMGMMMGLGITLFIKVFISFNSTLKKTFLMTLGSMICLVSIIYMLIPEYHILGTDKIGRDVFYLAIKSIRTGLVIGTVTTLVMLPFALLFGMWAGYFRGWLDDIIQYVYTTLSSVPGVLLIAGAMLSLQSKIEANPDIRLLILCVILGVTSWTTLCRLLRGETLKLRDSDFVQSAIALGVTPLKIIRRHITPNLMHIVIITVALDFSGLVLAEAVLSYVGVGVDPTSFSWGNMINAARLDMARDPIVWWSLSGALFFMFTLVFSANIFSDVLQEAFNPRKN